MEKRSFLAIVLMMAMVALMSVSALAIPGMMNYQGHLTDNTGSPLSGSYDMTFSIYNVNEDGTAIWSEMHIDVPVTDGVFNVILGQTGSLLDPEDFISPLFLGITVDSDPEMAPRQQITSVAFAFRAAKADSITDNGLTTVMIANEAVTGTKIASDEITSSHIAKGAVGTSEIEDNSVSSGDVNFNYAASNSKGGPATDLACSGCVSESELDFTAGLGDITAVYAGNGLSGGSLSGDVHLDVTGPLSLSISNWKYSAIHGIQTSATGGYGVYGENTGSGKNFGYIGSLNYGVRGEHSSGNFGYIGSSSYGIRGEHSNGNYGYLGGNSYGVRGYHSPSGNYGTLGSSNRGVYGYSSSGTAGYFDSPSGYGLIVSRGNVGIGTTTPDAKFEVEGDILIPDDSLGILRVGRYNATYPNAYIRAEASTEQMRLQIGTSTKIVIDDNGYVGIGTTDPETQLEIRGDGTSWRKGFLCIKNINEDAGIRLYNSAVTVKHHIYNLYDEGDILRLAPAGSYASGGITISQAGFVGIGTVSPNNELDVLGTIRAEEVIVETGWADYVFEDDYIRMDLDQVEKHIKLKGHLPGIPTEAEVKENGIGLGAFQVKLLEKIEELTLYMIEQNKKIEKQNNKIIEQNQKMSAMKEELDKLRHMVFSSSNSIKE